MSLSQNIVFCRFAHNQSGGKTSNGRDSNILESRSMEGELPSYVADEIVRESFQGTLLCVNEEQNSILVCCLLFCLTL